MDYINTYFLTGSVFWIKSLSKFITISSSVVYKTEKRRCGQSSPNFEDILVTLQIKNKFKKIYIF